MSPTLSVVATASTAARRATAVTQWKESVRKNTPYSPSSKRERLLKHHSTPALMESLCVIMMKLAAHTTMEVTPVALRISVCAVATESTVVPLRPRVAGTRQSV